MTSKVLADWLARPRSRVAVIGASGWIGMALVDRLLAADPGLEPDRLRLLGSGHSEIIVRGRRLRIEPLAEAEASGRGDWLVLHAAIVGPGRVAGADPAEVRRRNDEILSRTLDFVEAAGARRLVFFSSGAIYRQGLGSRAKQLYARMKADHEEVVAAWAVRGGHDLTLPRVFNLGGPYINHVDAYALGDFIQAAGRDGRIAVGAAHPVFRSYVHVLELAEVVLDAALMSGSPWPPFDVAGAEVVELRALARAVGRAMGIEDIPVERPAPDGAADWYVGDGRMWRTLLFETGREPVPLDAIVGDTLAWLQATGPQA